MSLEDQLVAAGGGDRAAFRAVFDTYGGAALAIALRVLREREAAEDAVQEAFLRLWRMASAFDPARGSARAWLNVIVRNTALDQIRARRPTLALELTDELAMAVSPVDPPDNRLRQCLERLPAEQARAIKIMYHYGMSHSELAAHMGQPLGTVKSWIRRGTLSLRECMDADGAGVCLVDMAGEAVTADE